MSDNINMQEKDLLQTINGAAVKNSTFTLKSVLGIIGAIVAGLLLFYALPGSETVPGGLSTAARGLAAIFVVALILWATEAVPIAVTSLLVLVLGPLLGVFEGLKGAVIGFTSPVIYFIIASFVLSTAVEKSGLGRRFALWLINRWGTNSKVAALVFMVGCGLISAIMSNIPACAIFMSLAIPILAKLGAEPGKSNLGKVFMMGIPIASLIGGVATPSGSSINILAIDLIKETSGIEISFVQWMAIGVPLFIIMIIVSWWILVKVIPPEVDSIGDIEEFRKDYRDLGTWNTAEKKTIIILVIMFILWVMSSWVKQIDLTMVAIAGAIVMFLPGIKLVNWKETEEGIGWDIILLNGAVTSLGLASGTTGLSQWIMDRTFGGFGELNVVLMMLIIMAFTVVIHLPIPINPSIIATMIPPIVALAASSGVNAAAYALPVAFTASCSFLLPLDSVPLITYSKGYYKMFDMFVPGALISIVWVIVMAVLMLLIGPVLGFM
jgi:sodium-dependent dicarboxylate transporter 2/3/5